MDRAQLFLTKLRLSTKTILWILSDWRYALLALSIAVIFFELIYWLFNFTVLSAIMFSGSVSFVEKLRVLISPIESIGTASGSGLLTLMLALALVQGISIAGLTFIVRHQQKLDDRLIGGSSFAALLAVIGLGCPACGTSLITPIVALFISGSAVAVSETITKVATPLALAIGLVGLYYVGLKASNTKVQRQQRMMADTISSNNNSNN